MSNICPTCKRSVDVGKEFHAFDYFEEEMEEKGPP